MSRRIVLWRHGRTVWNTEGRFQGQTDIELDDTGRAQAQRAAALLAALQPDLIISSDLRRAADTAAPLAKIMGLPVEQDKRLREIFAGDWQGMVGAEIRLRYPQEYDRWLRGDPDLAVGGGETRAEVAARSAAAIEDAAARMPEGGLAVLVTHGGAARLGIARLLGLPPQRFTNLGGLANCAWSMLKQSEQGWVLVEHNAGTLPEPVVLQEG